MKQSFYIALSQDSIRTRNKLSAGLINIRAGGRALNFGNFSEKISQYRKLSYSAENCRKVPKNVAHYRKRVIPYLYTLTRTIAYAYTFPNAFAHLNTLTRLHILIH